MTHLRFLPFLALAASWSLTMTRIMTPSDAFVLQTKSRHGAVIANQRTSALQGHGRYDPYGGGYEDDAMARNKARTDVRNFLTQRSIQSFVYLLNQCRDEQTASWIENALDFKKLDTYHGTGAFDIDSFPSWDSLFLDLVDRPKETIVVEVKRRGNLNRGLSGSNNYLDNLSGGATPPRKQPKALKPKAVSPVKDDTSSTNKSRPLIATNSYLENLSQPQPTTNNNKRKKNKISKKRKMRLRKKRRKGNAVTPKEDISAKTTQPSSSSAPPTSAGSYLDNLSKAQPVQTRAARSTVRKVNPYLEQKTVKYEFELDPASLVTRMISVREQISKEWEHDLETLILTNEQVLVSYADNQKESRLKEEMDEDDDDNDDDGTKSLMAPYSDQSNEETIVFDRSAMVMLTNSIATQGRDSSPFRRSNFDLLVLLSTQESIHRILREYADEEEDRMESFEWLKDFYAERVEKYFDGHQSTYGRADDFLEELLLSPPVVKKGGYGEISLIDPMGMAEDIIRERSEVARQWKEIICETQEEHTGLQRLLLTRRMLNLAESSLGATIFEAMEVDLSELGAFE